MPTTKVSDDSLHKVLTMIQQCDGISQKEITIFMGWSNQSTIAAVRELIKLDKITEIEMRSPGVTKDDVKTKGYIVE